MLLHALFVLRPMPLAAKCIAGAVLITAVEFLFGWVVNIRLGRSAWDYSNMKLNLYGQICLRYSCFFWFVDSTRFAVEQVAASSCASLFVIVILQAVSVSEKVKNMVFRENAD